MQRLQNIRVAGDSSRRVELWIDSDTDEVGSTPTPMRSDYLAQQMFLAWMHPT